MKPTISPLAAASLAIYCAAAAGDPGYYVVTAYNNPGMRTLDFRYWTVKQPGAAEVKWPEIGLGWSVNSRWYTEVLASYIGSSKFATRLSTLNWQNDILLTQGQYPFDIAFHTLLVRPQESSAANLFEFGPVFQTDVGRTQVNVNLFFERSTGAPSSKPTQFKYQWQLRHRWKPWFHFGAQGFGEPGPWDNWSPHHEQSHRYGPAVFGSLPAGAGLLAWQAAYLTGSTNAKHGKMFSMQMKYDF